MSVRVVMVTATAVTLAIVGLAGPAGAAVPVATDSSRSGQEIWVHSDKAGAVHLSKTTFHEGVVKFHVGTDFAQGSSVSFFQLKHGVTVAKLTEDLADEFSPSLLTDAKGTRELTRDVVFHGLADTSPGISVSVIERLYDGTYYAADFSAGGPQTPPVLTKITVTEGGDSHARIDYDDYASVSMTSADRFVVHGALPARGTVALYNVSDTIHFMQLLPIKPGTTDAQIQAFIDTGSQAQPPFALNGPRVSTDVLSPGQSLLFSYQLPKGTYVLACFVADSMTGMPHFVMGMHKVVVVHG